MSVNLALSLCLLLILSAGQSRADSLSTAQTAASSCPWVPGADHRMHWPQLPDDSGWSINATERTLVADDWMCAKTGLVTDFHWWGAWRGDIEGTIDYFFLAVHEDLTASESWTGFSMPGQGIWFSRIYTFDVTPITPRTAGNWYDPNRDTTYAIGDCDCDGISLTGSDEAALSSYLSGGTGFCGDMLTNCDFDGDCRVSANDLAVLQDYFNNGLSAFDPYGGYPVAASCDVVEDDHDTYYQYDICLDESDWFHLDSGTVYWFMVYAVVEEPGPCWGWKCTQDNFNDVAVGSDGIQWFTFELHDPIAADQPIDLAFVVSSAGYEESEACCLPDGSCQQLPTDFCLSHGGRPQGAGSVCDTIDCGGPTGACCMGGGSCQQLTRAACRDSAPYDAYKGDGSTCQGDSEPNGWDDICECCGRNNGGFTGNTNCSGDGKVTLGDITVLIDRIFISKAPLCCEASGNTNGSLDCKLTMADLTRMIDRIYISRSNLAPCMTECY